MTTYDVIYEELCDRVDYGELTLEDAEILNEAAYDRYVLESFRKDRDDIKLDDEDDDDDRKIKKAKRKTRFKKIALGTTAAATVGGLAYLGKSGNDVRQLNKLNKMGNDLRNLGTNEDHPILKGTVERLAKKRESSTKLARKLYDKF